MGKLFAHADKNLDMEIDRIYRILANLDESNFRDGANLSAFAPVFGVSNVSYVNEAVAPRRVLTAYRYALMMGS